MSDGMLTVIQNLYPLIDDFQKFLYIYDDFPFIACCIACFLTSCGCIARFLSTASGIFGTSIFISFNTSVSGIISTKEKRLRNAVSRSAIERSAVFIVPMIYTLEGTLNGSPEYGRITLLSSASPFLLDSSISVISSPKIRKIFPLLISSIMKTYGFSLSFFCFLAKCFEYARFHGIFQITGFL